ISSDDDGGLDHNKDLYYEDADYDEDLDYNEDVDYEEDLPLVEASSPFADLVAQLYEK
ncbi:hypothetical protein BGZ76_005230, partial [Entomortierella beljakovae]